MPLTAIVIHPVRGSIFISVTYPAQFLTPTALCFYYDLLFTFVPKPLFNEVYYYLILYIP